MVAAYGACLSLTGFFHAGELDMLRRIRARALPRKTVPPPPEDVTQAEMAGQIVSTPPEPYSDSSAYDTEGEGRPDVSPDFRSRRR